MRQLLFPALIVLFLGTGAWFLFQQHEAEQKPAPAAPAAPAEDFAKEDADLRVKADAGDAEAQYQLGGRYDSGKGVAADEAQAMQWWRKAAAQGHTQAAFELATMLTSPADGTANYPEAAKFYRIAADRGASPAQFQLALLYLHGDGVAKDVSEAAFWLALAEHKNFTVSPVVHNQVMGGLSAREKEAVERRVQAWKPVESASKVK